MLQYFFHKIEIKCPIILKIIGVHAQLSLPIKNSPQLFIWTGVFCAKVYVPAL